MSTFRCESCKRTFEKIRSDQAAEDEYQQIFEDFTDLPRAVICAECFGKIAEQGGVGMTESEQAWKSWWETTGSQLFAGYPLVMDLDHSRISYMAGYQQALDDVLLAAGIESE